MSGDIPHMRIVLAVSLIAVAGYAAFSLWAVIWSADAALRGDVIGTWKSFAVAAFAFWLGSSSGGKASTTRNVSTRNPGSRPGQDGRVT